MNDTHVFLRSDQCLDAFPENKPYRFTNILPESINFDGEGWVVGMQDITLIQGIQIWKQNTFRLTTPDTATKTYDLKKTLTIENVQDFASAISLSLPKMVRRNVTFLYDQNERNFLVQLSPGSKLEIPQEWSDIMGFDRTKLEGTVRGTGVADLFRGIHTPTIHTNIGSVVRYGGVYDTILGTIDLPDQTIQDGQPVSKIYNPPMYTRVTTKTVQTITVYIKDGKGQDLQLLYHPVTVRLRFIRSD